MKIFTKFKSRTLRLAIARAAMFAVVLNAWAPAVTSMIAASAGRTTAVLEHCLAMPEHCLTVSEDPGSDDPANPAKDKGASCGFCFAHAGSFGVTAIVHVVEVHAIGRYSIGSSFVATSAGHMPWLNARPRGPPATTA